MYHIMLIDDDPTSLAIGKALLGDQYRLTLIRSGQQALGSLLGADLPDLILMDMLMPGISGMEVLKQLKDDDRLKAIPVIFLTGESDQRWAVESYCGGAADFLSKPVDPDLLRIKIKRQFYLLELWRENNALKAGLRELQAKFNACFDRYLTEPEKENHPS